MNAELLDDVRAFIARFVAFPSHEALDAVTLWTAHTHLIESTENSPRLALLSPEPGSGKTRTLEVLDLLVRSPMSALNASTPAVFRSLKASPRTLLFDEVDAIFGRRGKDENSEDLRALLNAGHRRGATIPRCEGPSHKVVEFPVFAACALAGLGDLPDTVMSRSIIVRMRRRLPSESVEHFRRRLVEPTATVLRGQLAEWCGDVADRVAQAYPVMPEGVEDRPADVWEPLLQVADEAGGHWPKTAREACVELVKVSISREASLGVKLLSDLRDVFGAMDKLSTESVLERLCGIEESPWSDLRGKPLDARRLARMLRQYEIAPETIRVEDRTPKGYRLEQLHDAFERYLPPFSGTAQHPQQAEQGRSNRPFQGRLVPDVADVAPSQGAKADGGDELV